MSKNCQKFVKILSKYVNYKNFNKNKILIIYLKNSYYVMTMWYICSKVGVFRNE